MKDNERIIAATLMSVAAIASLMINLEKDFSRLKAIRRAIKKDVFKPQEFLWAWLPFIRGSRHLI